MLTVFIDSKTAWLTVVGGFLANMLLGGMAKSYGLVMEAFQEVFHSGAAYMLLAGGLIYTLMYCLSLVNHLLSERYGSRPVVVAGAIGSCLSLVLAALSPNLVMWVLCIGFGLGSSLSCIYFTVFAVVGRCFKRYLGLANGISVAGVSMGQMLFPTLISYLNMTYGARGGTIVMGAICLNLLVTAVLMPSHIQTDFNLQQQQLEDDLDKGKKKLREKGNGKCNDNNNNNDNNSNNKNNSSNKSADDKCVLLSIEEGMNKHPQSVFENGCNAINNNNNNYSGSNFKCGDQISVTTLQSSLVSLSLVSLDKLKVSVADRAKSLSRALLILYILAKAFGDVGDVSISFIAPAHGTHLGLTSGEINTAIAVAGAVDLLTRLFIGWITDWPRFAGKRGMVMAVTWLIQGTNSLLFAELDKYRISRAELEFMNPELEQSYFYLLLTYYICLGLHGACSGSAMTQMVVVLTDWVGSESLARALAISLVSLGLIISPGQFVIGYVADLTHSFAWSLRICGIILIVGGFLLFFEHPIRAYYSPSKSDPSSTDHVTQDTGSGVKKNNKNKKGKKQATRSSKETKTSMKLVPTTQTLNSDDTDGLDLDEDGDDADNNNNITATVVKQDETHPVTTIKESKRRLLSDSYLPSSFAPNPQSTKSTTNPVQTGT